MEVFVRNVQKDTDRLSIIRGGETTPPLAQTLTNDFDRFIKHSCTTNHDEYELLRIERIDGFIAHAKRQGVYIT